MNNINNFQTLTVTLWLKTFSKINLKGDMFLKNVEQHSFSANTTKEG